MEDIHKNYLKRNRVKLVADLKVHSFLNHLIEEEILTPRDKEIIDSKPTNSAAVEHLLDLLPTKGGRAFSCFYRILEKEYHWFPPCDISISDDEWKNKLIGVFEGFREAQNNEKEKLEQEITQLQMELNQQKNQHDKEKEKLEEQIKRLEDDNHQLQKQLHKTKPVKRGSKIPEKRSLENMQDCSENKMSVDWSVSFQKLESLNIETLASPIRVKVLTDTLTAGKNHSWTTICDETCKMNLQIFNPRCADMFKKENFLIITDWKYVSKKGQNFIQLLPTSNVFSTINFVIPQSVLDQPQPPSIDIHHVMEPFKHTLTGKVVQVFSLRKVKVENDPLPVRRIGIKDETGGVHSVSLWRQLAIDTEDLEVGTIVRITNLNKKDFQNEPEFQSTAGTKIEVIHNDVLSQLPVEPSRNIGPGESGILLGIGPVYEYKACRNQKCADIAFKDGICPKCSSETPGRGFIAKLLVQNNSKLSEYKIFRRALTSIIHDEDRIEEDLKSNLGSHIRFIANDEIINFIEIQLKFA